MAEFRNRNQGPYSEHPAKTLSSRLLLIGCCYRIRIHATRRNTGQSHQELTGYCTCTLVYRQGPPNNSLRRRITTDSWRRIYAVLAKRHFFGLSGKGDGPAIETTASAPAGGYFGPRLVWLHRRL